jgi:hypothetical protein
MARGILNVRQEAIAIRLAFLAAPIFPYQASQSNLHVQLL